MIEARYPDRHAAGVALADAVAARLGRDAGRCLVLALPRGGVPVAEPVALRLGAPLDLLLVRKIGAPGHGELAVAALVDVGGQPQRVVDDALCRACGADARWIDTEAERGWREIERQRARYLPGRAPLAVQGATVVLVDDGVATGTTMRAALQALRVGGAARRLVAVPVAPPDAMQALRRDADEVLCLREPEDFRAVGQFYDDFRQVSDDEVLQALARTRAGAA